MNEIRSKALRALKALGVKLGGWYAEPAEGFLSAFAGENDPDGPDRLLESIIERCPACNSPAPHFHPATQYEGEVWICPDPWHGQPTRFTRGNADPWVRRG